MVESKEKSDEGMRKFVGRHRGMVSIMIVAAIVAVIVAIFTFLWVVADLQAANTVPSVLGSWTVGYFFTFILHVIFWEIVFVASWVALLAVITYGLWYKKLPAKERKEYNFGRSKSARDGGGVTFAINLIWLIIVWFDGNWNLAVKTWTFDQFVYSYLVAIMVVLGIAGLLGLMYLIWLMSKGKKK